MMAQGRLVDSSRRCEHTVVVCGFTALTHITPVASEEAARSYSTQYLQIME